MDRPSPQQVSKHAVWLALARASFGAPAIAAPEKIVGLLGLSRRRNDDSHRFFGGFFGVRELLLGGFLLGARRDFRRLGPTVAFGALADLGDTALIVRELVRRQEVEPGAAFLLFSGLAGSAASIALWWEVRQVEGGAQPT
jgi:hypothetical protein